MDTLSFVVFHDLNEETSEAALHLGCALRNNTVLERIVIDNVSDDEEELVSDIARYLTGVLHFLRHGPSLQRCVLQNLRSACKSILDAAGANPSVKELELRGLDRPVDSVWCMS